MLELKRTMTRKTKRAHVCLLCFWSVTSINKPLSFSFFPSTSPFLKGCLLSVYPVSSIFSCSTCQAETKSKQVVIIKLNSSILCQHWIYFFTACYRVKKGSVFLLHVEMGSLFCSTILGLIYSHIEASQYFTSLLITLKLYLYFSSELSLHSLL